VTAVPQTNAGLLIRGPLRVLLAALLLLAASGIRAQQGTSPFTGPFRVSGILVDGNRKTKERIILRELTFHEGDTLAADALYEELRRSRENLLNMGLFTTVDLLPAYVNAHEVMVAITVAERWYWWPRPILQFADPNFNTWWLTKDLSRLNFGLELQRFNMRGRNETLIASAQLGYSKGFGLSYRVPYVDQRQRWGVEAGAAYNEQDEVTLGTLYNKRILLRTPGNNLLRQWHVGAIVTLRPALDLRHSVGLSWHRSVVADTVTARDPDHLGGGADRADYLSLNYTLTLDQRDSRSFPLSGTYAKVKLEQDGIGPGQPDVTALTAKVQRSWKRGTRWSFGGSLQGKVSRGSEHHYFLQEGLGYSAYLRGYEYYVMDGQHYVLGKVNLLFALVRPFNFRVEPIPLEAFRTIHLAVYINAFTDQGQVWDDRPGLDEPLSNHWQQAYGLGLDVVTSYDQVLRLEYAVNGRSETGFYLHFTQPF
jgi:outer membrane protein assembly factor BamA